MPNWIKSSKKVEIKNRPSVTPIAYGSNIDHATTHHGDTVNTDSIEEKRSEPRIILDQYYSVEFSLPGTGNIYKFKLRDLSSSGLCILVNETSAVTKHLKVEDTLDMTFHPPKPSTPVESLKTKIMHITKSEQAPFKGHYLVGLAIIEKTVP